MREPEGGGESDRARAAWLGAGALLVYLALSPWTILDQGYARENVAAAERWLAAVGAEGPGVTDAPAIAPRHGWVAPLLAIPALLAARLLPGPPREAADRLLSLGPPLATAAIVTLLFLWGRRLGRSPRGAVGLALGAAFGTLLWPYAYIGLETAQSVALLAAGYLGLAARGPWRGRRTVAFAACCAVAVAAKATGLFLLPAIVFLAWRFVRDERLVVPRSRAAALIAGALGVALAAAAAVRAPFWEGRAAGGQLAVIGDLLADSPLAAAFAALGLLASPNKGLAVYAPLALLGLFAWPRLWRRDPASAVFVGLAAGGLVAGFSALDFWSDETWGPRYLHAAVAPLCLCLAPPEGGGRARRLVLAAAVAAGLGVSALGALFPWERLHQVLMETRPATLETLQHDPAWNAVRFHAALLACWATDRCGEWPPLPRWYDFRTPPPAQRPPAVSLRTLAHPQALVLGRGGAAGASPSARALAAAALVAGLVLIARAGGPHRRPAAG